MPETERENGRGSMDVDEGVTSMDANPISTVLATPTADQDSLSQLAEIDTEMVDDAKSIVSHRSQTHKGVRIDDHYYFEDEEPELVKKKALKGLTDYQAAWYISDTNEDSDDNEQGREDEEMELSENEQDEYPPESSYNHDIQSEADDATSEMHVDLTPEEEARQYLSLHNVSI